MLTKKVIGTEYLNLLFTIEFVLLPRHYWRTKPAEKHIIGKNKLIEFVIKKRTFGRHWIKNRFYTWWGHVTSHMMLGKPLFGFLWKALPSNLMYYNLMSFGLKTAGFRGRTEPRFRGERQVEVINSRHLLPWLQINCAKYLTMKSSHCSTRRWHQTFGGAFFHFWGLCS